MTQLLARCAARRAHVLTVEAPGYWAVRAEAERRLRARGWCVATSPADADVLAVCGAPGPELSEALDRVWDQLPGPRVRVDIGNPETVDSALDRAFVELVDTDRHRNDARERAQSPSVTDDHDDMDHSGGHHHMDPGSHQQMDHSDMDHGEHGHMQHGDMDMAPAGIALAEGADDRDGLEMDVLHVRLGPVLRYWPAGLVLRCSLQGDVLTTAEAWVVDSDHPAEHRYREEHNDTALAAARQCDHVTDLLALAGWPRAAATARMARDALLSRRDLDRARPLLDTLHAMIRRSRLLRWSLRDLAPLTGEDCERLQLPTVLGGDCYERLLTRVGMVRRDLSDPLWHSRFSAASDKGLDALPDLVSGLELATARLVIASLAIDTAGRHEVARDG